MEVDSSTGSWIALLVLLAVQATFAAARTSIINVRRSRSRDRQDDLSGQAAQIERLVEDSTRFRATNQTISFLTNLSIGAVATVTFVVPLARLLNERGVMSTTSWWLSIVLVVLLLGIVILVLGELLPSLVALRYSEQFSSTLLRPYAFVATIIWPITRLVIGLSRLIAGIFGGGIEAGMPLVTEEEIKSMVDAGEEEGFIEADEKEMILSIFEFGDTLAREVMVPRIDITAIEVSTSITEALGIIIGAGHSRIPVYADTIDNIVGILYAKDLLPVLLSGDKDVRLETVLRRPYFIPETKKVDDLLPDLRQRKVHMAVVVDEYGGTAGLVTIEDLLEEIVGEIQDEYDSEEPIYEVISDEEYVLSARINLDDLAKLLSAEFPNEDSDTLGGLIYDHLGRVPSPGDVLDYDGLQITVLSVEGRRINKVRVVLDRSAGLSKDATITDVASEAEQKSEE